MPSPTPSLAPKVVRLPSVTLIVTMPVSSLEIATPVTSGAVPESPATSANEPVFPANAAPANASAATPRTASAHHVDPFIAASVAQNSEDVTSRYPSPFGRRRRLARAPRPPRTAAELPPRRRPPGQRAARFLQLHRAPLAVGAAAGGARWVGLARHTDVPARA